MITSYSHKREQVKARLMVVNFTTCGPSKKEHSTNYEIIRTSTAKKLNL